MIINGKFIERGKDQLIACIGLKSNEMILISTTNDQLTVFEKKTSLEMRIGLINNNRRNYQMRRKLFITRLNKHEQRSFFIGLNQWEKKNAYRKESGSIDIIMIMYGRGRW